MELTKEQREHFDREGYLFFPGLFSEKEIKVLLDEVPALYAQRRPENVREKDSDAVRTNFAAHMYSNPFARLARHPRMVEPIKQLFDEDVYMHQFKVNGKFNGPLMLIPGSHKLGVIDAQHDTSTTSYPLWTISHDTIRKLIDRGGIVAPKGPAGSMILFHSCLVHASSSNLSPWDRINVYLSLCAVSNHIRRFKRPEYIAHRDFTPIDCLPDDCLLKDYDVPLPWKEGTPEQALKPLAA